MRRGLVYGLCLILTSCSVSRPLGPAPPAPDYFTQVVPQGIRYAHNYQDRPCFSMVLGDEHWIMKEATQDRVLWRRGQQVLNVYLTDNRQSGFAVSGMNDEQALNAFIGSELEYVKPRFDVQDLRSPRTARDRNGLWSQWSWKGHGGKIVRPGQKKPLDQQHVIASLWLDPWVLSFDWATTQVTGNLGPTPEMIDVLESLTFNPKCFAGMRPGETWKKH